MYSLIDIILIVIICVFTFKGFNKGFVKTVGYLLSYFIGIILAFQFFLPIYIFIQGFIKFESKIAEAVIFILILLIFIKLIKLLISAISNFFKIPIINSVNRVLGALFGFVEGILILGTIIFLFSNYMIFTDFTENMLATSEIAIKLANIAFLFYPFIPKALKELQGIL